VFACLVISSLVSVDGGGAELAVLFGEVRGRFPYKVSSLAHGEVPEGGLVDVGADGQVVVGAGQAGPGTGGLVCLAVLKDVLEVVGDPGQPESTAEIRVLAGCSHVGSPPGWAAGSVCCLPVRVAAGDLFQYRFRGRHSGFGRLEDSVTARCGPGGECQAEIFVLVVFGRDHQRLPFGELAREFAVLGGQRLRLLRDRVDVRSFLEGLAVRFGLGFRFGGAQRRPRLIRMAAA
jgi:hypothetical protein